MNNDIKGIIPVLVTPLDQYLNIDFKGFDRLIAHLEVYEFDAYWVLGTGAEDMNLTFEERLSVVEYVTKKLPSKKLIVGCGFLSQKESHAFINELDNFDVTDIHLLPYNHLLSLERVREMYLNVCDKTDKKIWMYSSANWGRELTPSFVGEMKKTTRQIVGVKYSTSNIVTLNSVCQHDDNEFMVISAVAGSALASLSVGVRAMTSVEACLYPDDLKSIYDSFIAGDITSARHFQNVLSSKVISSTTRAKADNFLRVAEIKYLLSKLEIVQPYVSKGLRSLSLDEIKYLDENISKLM